MARLLSSFPPWERPTALDAPRRYRQAAPAELLIVRLALQERFRGLAPLALPLLLRVWATELLSVPG